MTPKQVYETHLYASVAKDRDFGAIPWAWFVVVYEALGKSLEAEHAARLEVTEEVLKLTIPPGLLVYLNIKEMVTYIVAQLEAQ